MFERLRDNWVYGGFLAALMLLALTPILKSGWPLALLLIWLQLPVYMLHQYEEHDGDRFRLFVNATIGGGREILSRFAVFVINIGGVWGVDAGAFALATRVHIGFGLIAVYLSLINGVSHCVMAAAMRCYNPGLVTSILLFIPLGVATLWVLAGANEFSLTDHCIGFVVALLVHLAIIALIVVRKKDAAAPIAMLDASIA
jgi:Protein of unknown function with HXXEE motif